VTFQGGDVKKLNAQVGTRRAKFHGELKAAGAGWHGGWDALECGLAATALGAGRNKKEDAVLPDVGLEFLAKRGDSLKKGEGVLKVWADSQAKLDETLSRLETAWTLSATQPVPGPLVLGEVTAL